MLKNPKAMNTTKKTCAIIILLVKFPPSWRASEASETLSGVYKFELMRYVYIYIFIYYIGAYDQSDRSVGLDYISLYHLTSLLMQAIGPKVWIK